MDYILHLLSLVGSLALFLYGMKIMSEGLEKVAGSRLRIILAAVTKNRFKGVLLGLFITAVIQSSSATTVMVVSFVNAGLMTLTQAIGVIMGANIGTTVTAWIISLIGFKIDVASLALPLLALAIPLIFSKKGTQRNLGEFIFGFSFLFMGLSFLQASANDLNIGDMVANMMTHIVPGSWWVILLFVIIGMLVTMVVQASAATMAITLMLFDMQIPGFGFEEAAALAMGQNIGTTITAVLASLTTNTQARRAALAHMVFNVLGVVIVLLIFKPFCSAITWFCENYMGGSHNDMYRLSAFHTAFNVFNTLLLIGFVNQIQHLVCRMLPQREKNKYRLKFISNGILSTAELSILQARKEIGEFAERCYKMFGMVRDLINTEKGTDFNSIYSRIEKYESITDAMDVEIAKYLNEVSEGRLSNESKESVLHMLRTVSELESIGDACFNLSRTLNSKRQNLTENFTDKQREHILNMLNLVDMALVKMVAVVKSRTNNQNVDISPNKNIEVEINNYRTQLKSQNMVDVNNGVYSYQLGTFYVDFISECEKMGDYIMNVVESEEGQYK